MVRKSKFYNNTLEWIDIENPSDEELKNLQLPYEVDGNYLEDAFEPGHLPKFERTVDHIFMILRAYTASEGKKAIEVGAISNKIAFLIYDNVLVTIHRQPFPFLDFEVQEVKSINKLVLIIVNNILATYREPTQNQADKMDMLEQRIFLKGGINISLEKLYYEKSTARLVKKILVIMQNVINEFEVEEDLRSNLQDIKDTTIDLILRNEEIVEDANGLLNSYMSFTAQKNNDVMKLLTIFSAFFLPLTFIAGIYGMNFEHMPELSWRYGYFIIVGIMIVISLAIYLWFRLKKIM